MPAYMEDRIFFWKGQIYKDMKRHSQAQKTLTKLVERKRYGYYHMLALKLLKRPLKLDKRLDMKRLQASFLDPQSSHFIHWLILFNESEILSSYLDFKKKDFLDLKKQGEEGWLKVLLLLHKARRHLEIFQTLEVMEPQIREKIISQYYALYFPFDFEEEVQGASLRYSLA